MKKKWSLLTIFCLSAIMLAACNEKTVEEDVKGEVQIEGQKEVKKEQEMTLDEGRTIITDLYKKIIDELVTYGDQQGIVGEKNITDSQVAEVMEKLKPYGTGTYYEENLKFIAANLCYGGCELVYFDYYLSRSNFIRGDIESISSTEIKTTDYAAADPIGWPPHKFVTTLLLEENTWKIAKVEREEVSDLQITENEIVTIANKAGYENVKVSAIEKQTINGVDTIVYKVQTETQEITLLGTTGEIMEEVALNVATEEVEVEDEDKSDYEDVFDKLVKEYYDNAKNEVMPADYGDAYQNANTTKSIKEAKASIQKLYTETEKQVVALMSKEVDYTESKARDEEATNLWQEFRETMLKELIPNLSKKEAQKLLENLFKKDAYLGARVFEKSGGARTYTDDVAFLYYSFIEEDTKKLYETFVLNK